MPRNEVATEEQLLAYGNLKHYGSRGMYESSQEQHRAMLTSIGVVANSYRMLNGHEYPRFETTIDYTRYLRYGMTFDQHMQHDIDVWFETIRTVRPYIKQNILARIFIVLRYNNFRWKRGNDQHIADPQDYGQTYEWPLASALAHGSRICFIIPKATHTGFRSWISGDQMARGWTDCVIPHRTLGISTHSAEPILTRTGRVDVKEKKGVSTGSYGMNLAMGEMGGPSPITGRTLSDNGGDGHLYLYESNVTNLGSLFSPKKYKIMMIGIEASGSGQDDMYGSAHGTGQEQRGCGVGIYWHKNEAGGNPIGMDTLPGSYLSAGDLPAKYGGMVVHLTQTMAEMQQRFQTLRSGTWDEVKALLDYIPSLDRRAQAPVEALVVDDAPENLDNPFGEIDL